GGGSARRRRPSRCEEGGAERQALRPWPCARSLQIAAWSGRQRHRRQAPSADRAVGGADGAALPSACRRTAEDRADQQTASVLPRGDLAYSTPCRDGVAVGVEPAGSTRTCQRWTGAEAAHRLWRSCLWAAASARAGQCRVGTDGDAIWHPRLRQLLAWHACG